MADIVNSAGRLMSLKDPTQLMSMQEALSIQRRESRKRLKEKKEKDNG